METGQVNERFHAEKEMVMETLFVIGAGTMGGGIAQVAALNGFTVYLYDIKQEFVDRGLKGIAGAWDKLVARGKMSAEDRDAALPRIIGTLDMQDAAKADVVIEAAVEDLDVKRSIFSKLDGIVSPGCILATNTSSLSVTAVASAVGRPDKVVGLHFFNPVPRMALIEIIRGAATSDETYEAAKALSERLGKTAVTVQLDKAVEDVLDEVAAGRPALGSGRGHTFISFHPAPPLLHALQRADAAPADG